MTNGIRLVADWNSCLSLSYCWQKSRVGSRHQWASVALDDYVDSKPCNEDNRRHGGRGAACVQCSYRSNILRFLSSATVNDPLVMLFLLERRSWFIRRRAPVVSPGPSRMSQREELLRRQRHRRKTKERVMIDARFPQVFAATIISQGEHDRIVVGRILTIGKVASITQASTRALTKCLISCT